MQALQIGVSDGNPSDKRNANLYGFLRYINSLLARLTIHCIHAYQHFIAGQQLYAQGYSLNDPRNISCLCLWYIC